VEYIVEADRFWPPVGESSLGVRDGIMVPPSDLDDPDVLSVDAQHSVVTPGWINAHAHLELSGARDIEFNGNFADWIWDVLEFKLSLDPEEILDHYRQGCRELVESGVARVVDHCDRTDLALDALSDVAPDVVLLKELIAFDPASIEETQREARQFLERCGSERVRFGLAPHAPYSAHPDLYRWAEEEREDGAPMSSHFHEVREELEFAENDTGPLRDLLEERSGTGVEIPYDGERPIPYLHRNDDIKEPLFGIHLNYLNDEDLRWLETETIRPVFCPKSYSYFRHETLPVEDWMERSLPFALGTDSRASNSSLDMLSELRRLSELTDEPDPEDVLRALTSVPANVIGVPDRGVLAPGTPADLSVFDVPSGELEDLAAGRAEARAVMVDGRLQWSAADSNNP
jgi:cytosine/adenosine deaminase-related metal-dependent hydrolase